MNEINLLKHRQRNALMTKYHESRAELVAATSGFSEISYSCEYYVQQILNEKKLARHFRARVMMCDKALSLLTRRDAEALRLRNIKRHSVEEIAELLSLSVRNAYRILREAEYRFSCKVQQLLLARQAELSKQKCLQKSCRAV